MLEPEYGAPNVACAVEDVVVPTANVPVTVVVLMPELVSVPPSCTVILPLPNVLLILNEPLSLIGPVPEYVLFKTTVAGDDIVKPDIELILVMALDAVKVPVVALIVLKPDTAPVVVTFEVLSTVVVNESVPIVRILFEPKVPPKLDLPSIYKLPVIEPPPDVVIELGCVLSPP